MVYDQLSALLLDKQSFGKAFLAYTIEVMKELWPEDCKETECTMEVKQAVARFEDVLKTIAREMMKGLPIKRLENANSVKQLSFEDKKDTVLLVLQGKGGENTMVCSRNRARLFRSAFNVIHAKELMKEAFLRQSQLIGNEKNASRNGAIWAFTAQRYWTQLAKDIAVIIDYSKVAEQLNV